MINRILSSAAASAACSLCYVNDNNYQMMTSSIKQMIKKTNELNFQLVVLKCEEIEKKISE